VAGLVNVHRGDRDQPDHVAGDADRCECLTLDTGPRHELVLETRTWTIRPHLGPCTGGGPLQQVASPRGGYDFTDEDRVQRRTCCSEHDQPLIGVLEDQRDIDQRLIAQRPGDQRGRRLGRGLDLELPERGNDRKSCRCVACAAAGRLTEVLERFARFDREIGDSSNDEHDDAHERHISKDDPGHTTDLREDVRTSVQHEDHGG
jgi:hypothetical protein